MDISNLREHAVTTLARMRMYHTLALLQQVSVSHNSETPSASVRFTPSGISITLGDAVCSSKDTFLFVLCHEIRHIYQIATYLEMQKMSKFEKRIANAAMDAALHEDLIRLFPTEAQATKDVLGGMVTVESLQETIDRKAKEHSNVTHVVLERNQDWVYYYNRILDIADELPPSFDEHEIEDGVGDLIRHKLMTAKDVAQRMGTTAGHQAMDSDLTFDPRAKLMKTIRDALEQVRIVTKRLSLKNPQSHYTCSAINHAYGYLPGVKRVPGRTRQAVLLLDVSGSMCNPETLSQLYAGCKHMEASGKLLATYTFDADIRPFSLDAKAFVGGGGTVISDAMMNKIYKDHGNNLDVVVLSDLEIAWDLVRTQHRFHLIKI